MESRIAEIENVDLYYESPAQETLAIENLSFYVEKGEFVSIVGPSGCGKTSVLSLLTGLTKPTHGTVRVMGEPAGSLNGIGYMLQNDHLLAWRTVEENVLLGLRVKHLLTEERKQRAFDLLDRYGLSAFRTSYPSELSGGMRQKVALIRTLAFDPELLLLDEPFSALDYQTRLSLADEVYSILKSEGKTALLVTHDIAEAVSLSDRVLVFTARPARIRAEHTIGIDRSLTPFMRRNDPAFSHCFNTIWRELTTLET